jgi:homocysteine S-methyltransferase
MNQDFLTTLARRVVLADGAMGSMLFEQGAGQERFDLLNLERPELVRQVHEQYLAAGSECLETNTFGANIFKLGQDTSLETIRDVNIAGARLARECAGNRAFVAGSLGPPGRLESPADPGQIAAAYATQARALAEGGADLLILETFASLPLLLTALEAVKKSVDIPLVAQLVFIGLGRTPDGREPRECFQALCGAGADVVGLNCGLGPKGALDVLKAAGRQERPVSVFPNAGFPEQVGDRMLYTTSPDYFAETVSRAVDLGAALVGGCCGTGPEHIRAAARLLSDASRPPEVRIQTMEGAVPQPAHRTEPPEPGLFARKLGREKMVLVELDPPKHLEVEPVLQAARELADAGAGAITVAENPLAQPRLSNTAMAHMIREETGAEVVVHLTGRDRNALGMQSALMGLSARGLDNVLAVTGDPPSRGAQDVVSGVFDLKSFDLMRLLTEFNHGRNLHGDDMRRRSRFCIGGAFNPNTRNPGLQVKRMQRKMESGASFFMTQPVYSRDHAELVAELTGPLDVPVFLGIMPLASHRNAEFLHNEFPGINIPDPIRERMRRAGDSGQQEGIEIAWELMEHAWSMFAGIYIIPPFNRYLVALELMNRLDSHQGWRP